MTLQKPQRLANLGFTAERFPEGTHMCLFYVDDDVRRRLVGQFLAAGLCEGEKVAYFADSTAPADVAAWVREAGVDPSESERTGRFSVAVAEEVYCPNGSFVPEEMLDALRSFWGDALAEGCAGGRVTGEMSWALSGIPGSDRLIEYEMLLNDLFATRPVTAICQYDARRFEGGITYDVLRVHPFVIVNGNLLRNTYYKKS
jgi:hypothetical protein